MRFHYYVTYKMTIAFDTEDDDVEVEVVDGYSEAILDHPISSIDVVNEISEMIEKETIKRGDFEDGVIEEIIITNWILMRSEQFTII